MPNEPSTAADSFAGLAWFQRWRRTIEVGFWIALTLVNAIANSVTVSMDIRREGLDFSAWKPVVWEWSSGIVILLLIPAVVWLTRRFPLHWGAWRRHLPWLLLGSVAFSLLHVAGMVALRELAYASQGQDYDFVYWPSELIYEYLKDVRGYVMIVSIMESYRFIIRRLQGEASLLGPPDEGEPVEPVDRPERFLVRKLGREFLIAANDIEWLQASGNYVNLRVRGHDYPLRSTIAGIEARLDPGRFARIHRSYIVNLGRIASIEPLDTGDARLHMHEGGTVPCSRRYRDALRSRIGAA
jgi:LytTr DNA-binding domain